MGLAIDTEQLILTTLINDPSLLEKTPDLCVNTFSRAEYRRVFAAITDIWEDRKPGSVDESELLGCANVTPEELQGITKGREGVSPERFFTLASDLLASIGPKSIRLSDVKPEPVSWLWPNYFPISKISLISGDPGVGKTWFCLDLAARLSKGINWPDDSPASDSGNTLILSFEDNPADTFRPRLDKLKANTTKIFILHHILDLSSEAGRRSFISEIEYRNPRLIIVDPALDYSGKVNPNAVDQVRSMLTPLSEIAEKKKAAIILTSHLNKSSVMEAIYRTAGSASGWVGKARAVFLITKEKEHQGESGQCRRIFAPIKTNLSSVEPQAFFFRISNNPGLIYEKVPKDFNLEALLASDHRKSENSPQLEEARTFLIEILKAGTKPKLDILREAQEAGIKEKTLYRAKKPLGIHVFREGGTHGRWVWGIDR